MTAPATPKSETNTAGNDIKQPAGLRRSCLVCRIIGLALVLTSILLLMASSMKTMDIGAFAAFLLYWLAGAGATLVILSISAMRQASNASQ